MQVHRLRTLTLRKKCPYSKLFSPNAGKYGPEQLRIRTLFTQCIWNRKVDFDFIIPANISFTKVSSVIGNAVLA